MKSEFRRMMMGSTHNTIYMPDIQAFRMPLPPVGEQREIVARVKVQTAQIDELIAEAESGTELLQERRSALISAAVTGKIDVRCLQPEVV
jgi:type I restriction enzyme S subunit